MKFVRTLTVLLLSGGWCYGASLAVYQDKTFYHFTPKHNFIGFSQGVKAKCEGTTVPLSATLDCPLDDRLCKLLSGLKTSEKKVKAVQSNIKTLEALVSLPKPATIDANALIASAKRIGEAQARLFMEERSLTKAAEMKEKDFLKQAPVKQALEMTQTCNKEVALTIPYGYVSFSTHYEADIQNTHEISVRQYLSVTNRSGIDIEAQTAMFYYRSAKHYVDPVYFRPWIVRKYNPIAKRVSKKALEKMMPRRDSVMMTAASPSATYEDAREYKVQNLSLPSNGVPLEVEVLRWSVPVSCEVSAYPYIKTKAFQRCSFEPKYQIESHVWKVRSAETVINEHAAGEYREGKYMLYTKVEEDIQIKRKQIVEKERETGIFGGTVRKKDGFTLTFTNKSDKEKTFTVIERIPASTTEEIQSKLLSINSEKKVDYTVLKDGKIEMRLTLTPYETKVINVLFELSYDKDVKVKY